ncbi:disease resistance protein L6-like [Rhodamnia argentea]|uniref:Disease resistance protein L6-like n=1 Tax=Rhodamnia argentea TaxID=178133 RepID=A0ABM3HBN3_9MYRT|nr:disease resistance protein L6-like [Rhodamnia argentea]
MEPPQGNSTTRDYEVFLSFRGPDTRLTMTDTLYAAMIRAGIHVFKDDEELRVGEEIGGELLRAISNSKIYVPIFSKDYASSKWCLRELAYMVACRKRGEKVILPIFYDVDASDVKLKTGSYGKALQKHERESGEDVAKQWEEALREVAGIKGWNLKDHGLEKLIALVLEEVIVKLRPTKKNWHEDLVGIHDRMEAVMELLAMGNSDVRFVVIHGMGGSGKTTLAKAIFKRISSLFQRSSFLSDIRTDSISSLQKKLLCDILDIRHEVDADNTRDMIKERLNDKKVIVVLDDMDKRAQLKELAGQSTWFGSGSRIIITTRNTYFLAPEANPLSDHIVPARHGDFFFYEMKEMQFDHALQLFSKHSFESDTPPHDYISISSEIVKITGGLPLALEVIGSLLYSKGKITWKDTLNKLKEVPNENVKEKLLISYEELEYEQRQIFLDIACHCNGEERVHAYYLWKACKFFPTTGIIVLIHLSLIKVIENDRLWMHDQLRDLGREIVRQECFQVPGKRSRLWCPTVALDVVQNNLAAPDFMAAPNLSLPRHDDFAVPLLPDSIGGLKSLLMLKVKSQGHVRELPHSIGDIRGLEHLSLHGCIELRKLPNSIGELTSLLCLDLSNTDIRALPNSIGRLESLLEMNLSQTPIAELPDSLGNLTRLKFLYLDRTKIRELPKSIWTLENLEELIARGCEKLEGEIPSEIAGMSQLNILNLSRSKVSRVPTAINQLSNLRELLLSNCNELQSLPNLPTSLRKLKLSSSSLQAVPDLSNLTSLLHLDISDHAYDFQLLKTTKGRVPHPNLDWLGRLHELQMLRLVLSHCNLPPTDLSSLSQLRSLDMTCPDPRSLTQLPSSLEELSLEHVKSPIEWPLFSNLGNLSELKLFGCRLREIEFDNVLGQLENLQRLQVRKCKSLVRLSNLASIKELRVLSVEYCPQLIEIESTLKLEKLESLRVYYCGAVQKLPRIPNACEVDVIGCPGLQGYNLEYNNYYLGYPSSLNSNQMVDSEHINSDLGYSNFDPGYHSSLNSNQRVDSGYNNFDLGYPQLIKQ